ncbi:transglutaminase family protein [Marinobacterium sedimentorum]|uniref:transglutaminase family protein n=1 Tax=Marinobacterium sedimentorum TaxID=2927804 RepID=UPI0020C6635A|nr:transglutaminase family protein [Marinobacterium sedimentorum]MCP8686001.1 transglutaminase family protein [Marinobacterium sedimentorum]
MQRYKIVHHTYYNFSNEVSLGEHTLLLRPREDHELRIQAFSLDISPAATLLWHRDVEDNSVALANFTQPCRQLVVKSEVIIQQYNEAPLDFLVSDYALSYPFSYQPNDEPMLAPYHTLPDAHTSAILHAWIGNFWQAGEKIQTYSLLQRIAEHIYQTLSYRVREEPGVQSARQTLEYGTGSCRDFAVLFMEAARYLGLAARFVSGYLHAILAPDSNGATHAWAEVYLPGAGWKGFDPTIGKIAGTDHIAVAVARLPHAVPPIAGSYRGSASSTLDVGVWVTKV